MQVVERTTIPRRRGCRVSAQFPKDTAPNDERDLRAELVSYFHLDAQAEPQTVPGRVLVLRRRSPAYSRQSH